ncbi:uncharacterized protein V1513DRAFT_380958 [Lipomyces chichibuensis]|uniref:uncharacterized protein n=1 Tax=Lipomyces chichibuensis TaxID=1546026 RepID=UPI0033439D42
MEGEEELATDLLFAFDLIEDGDVPEEDPSVTSAAIATISQPSTSGVSTKGSEITDSGAACQIQLMEKQQEQGEWDFVIKDSPFDFVINDNVGQDSSTKSPLATASTISMNEMKLSAREAPDTLTLAGDTETTDFPFRITLATEDGEAAIAIEDSPLDKIEKKSLPSALAEDDLGLPPPDDWHAQMIKDAPDFDVLPEEEFDILPPEEEFDNAQNADDTQDENFATDDLDSANTVQRRKCYLEAQQSNSDSQIPLFDGQSSEVRPLTLPHSDHGNAFYRKAKGSNGREIVLRARSRFLFNTLRESSSGDKYKRSSYGVDIEKIMLDIEKEDRDKKLRILQNEPETVSTKYDALFANNSEGELWVEKWRAKKWIDLIGDERTHRTLLRWLQQWSHVVFKNPVSAAPNKRRVGNSNAGKLVQTDPFHRPHKKLLLLHGAPGLGKTTVAHVAARQAGYDVLEINASDERGGALVHDKIRGAIDSHRVGTKPVCIIIDEIDGGAESGFIRVLLDILSSDSKATQQGHRTSANDSKNKRKKTAKYLLRPVIAICNDPFVSALRSLRPLAEILSYRRAPTPNIVPRLKEICAREKLFVDSRTLTELVDSMDGDVRGCINTLQFDMSGKRIGSSSVGQKDVNVNPNVIVGRVFKVDKHCGNKEESIRAVIEKVERSAEFDKVVTGCFTMYPSMYYADDMLAKPVEAGEWLHFYDTLSHSIYQDQHLDLAAYLSYPVGAFHSMFSSNSNSLKEYAIAKTDYEAYEAKKSNKDLVKQIIGSASAATQQSFRNGSTICTELAPYLMHIVNPKLNPVNASIVLEQERIMTMHTVDVMIDFAMKYIQQRCDNGTYVFRMDPPIEQLALFSTQDKDRAAVGKYLIRQCISQEMERNMLLRASKRNVVAAGSQTLGVKRRKSDSLDGVDHEAQESEEDFRLLHKAKRKHSASNKAGLMSSFFKPDRTHVDVTDPEEEKPINPSRISFFKSQTSATSTGLSGLGGHSRQNSLQEWQERMKQLREGRVWVQFHEGFSNAVRKPVTWSDFWRDL